jgi:hypothetical protein
VYVHLSEDIAHLSLLRSLDTVLLQPLHVTPAPHVARIIYPRGHSARREQVVAVPADGHAIVGHELGNLSGEGQSA